MISIHLSATIVQFLQSTNSRYLQLIKLLAHMHRLQNLANSLTSLSISYKQPDDVVICAAVRTPLTRAKKGLLKDTAPEVMLSVVLKEVAARGKIQPKDVQDIAVGCNLQPGAGQVNSRMGMLLADYPQTTPIVTINRLCSSGLETCSVMASKIKAGILDNGIAAGVEWMSTYKITDWVKEELLSPDTRANPRLMSTIMSLGMTAENVAERYGITREKQDQFALQSQLKAAKAQELGLFKDQIVPVKTKIIDEKGNEKEVVATTDCGVRKETTLASLTKLKAVFKNGGSVTAGNSSQISDGAAAVLLARRSYAQRHGLPILAKFVHYSVKGCQPDEMGIGPIFAIPDLLAKTGKKIQDIDIWELNEAFASQAVYCAQKLGIDKNKMNPKGGAIALGHPLGCTGARQIATLIPELKRTNKKLGVVSMCVGTGMGAAALIENE